MALNPSTNGTMAGRVTAPDVDYTYGSSQDETSPGANDGSPYFEGRSNDIFGLQQALLRLASIVPSGSADTQLVSEYVQALTELAGGRAINGIESGAANVYVFDQGTNQHAMQSLFVGMHIRMVVSAANTGACTVDAFGLGVKDIKNKLSQNPLAGELGTVIPVDLIYDGTNFILQSGSLHTLVVRVANLSVANASFVGIPAFTEFYDSAGAFAGPSTVDMIVPAGVSQARFEAKVDFDADATGGRQVRIEKNLGIAYAGFGRDQSQAVATAGRNTVIDAETAWLPVVAGDSFTVSVLQDSGGLLDIIGEAAGHSTWFYGEFR